MVCLRARLWASIAKLKIYFATQKQCFDISLCFFFRFSWLYTSIHQLHHQHRLPFAFAAQDASSVELLSLLLLALCSCWALGCHPLSEVLFHLLNSWMAVEDHCGYNLPWALHRLLPCLGGAPFHQAHHRLHRGNYAPYFTHWDQIFGTYHWNAEGWYWHWHYCCCCCTCSYWELTIKERWQNFNEKKFNFNCLQSSECKY